MTKHFYYTDEKNVQIVISLLKQNGIKRIIASPGTTNMTFVMSIQSDPFFEIISAPDERSAAYMACGMAAETKEPVALSCTGATASRNYMPGLTEAFYRKLPILAVTSHRGDSQVGHLIEQQIDRRHLPSDIVVESVTVPLVVDKNSYKHCIDEVNKAIIALKSNGGGPAHINLYTNYSKNFSVRNLPMARKIEKYTITDDLPSLPDGKIGIYVGAHFVFTDTLTNAIENFCSTYNAVVFTSHISGYRGKYEFNPSLLSAQVMQRSDLVELDLLISIGEVAGSPFVVKSKEVWRVSLDGLVRDTYGKLTKVFQMDETYFFNYYGKEGIEQTNFLISLKNEDDILRSKIPELPFSNPWLAQIISERLPQKSRLHLGILNSLRTWNFFSLPKSVNAYSNVGGYGIDGGLSTLIGASLTDSKTLFYGIFGDLAFFYDMNVLGNRHIGPNVRILLVNNGKGAEFTNYAHPCEFLGAEANNYIASAGHYGNKSKLLVRHFAEDLGFMYLSASDKQQAQEAISLFLDEEISSKPIIFETFINDDDESIALEIMRNLNSPCLYDYAKNIAKTVLPESMIKSLKNKLK